MPGSAPTVQPYHNEPPILSHDMTPADLVDVLEHPPFRARPVLIRVDRDVATFLVRACKPPNAGRRLTRDGEATW